MLNDSVIYRKRPVDAIIVSPEVTWRVYVTPKHAKHQEEDGQSISGLSEGITGNKWEGFAELSV